MTYLENVSVVITKDRSPPADHIQEVNGLDADINAGCKGKDWVWLVARRTHDEIAAGGHLRVFVTDKLVPGMKNLGSGDGGKYRYVSVERSIGAHQKITKVALYRKTKEQGPIEPIEIEEAGFDRCSDNINQDRDADYLYLVYKVKHNTTQNYLEQITVIAQKEPTPPEKYMKALNGLKSDINAGFGGDYVWLFPHWSHYRTAGGTHLRLFVTDEPVSDAIDLASGTSGKHRYITVDHDSSVSEKIVGVALYRKSSEEDPITAEEVEKHGYNRFTDNINQGRGGDYLYVIYKVEEL